MTPKEGDVLLKIIADIERKQEELYPNGVYEEIKKLLIENAELKFKLATLEIINALCERKTS